MFTNYRNLNEGRCMSSEKKCGERKLREGTNPKLDVSKNNLLVNSRWEKLRK